MAAASIEAAAPEATAGIVALTAIAAIEVAAIRWGKPPISPLVRYNVRRHPVAASVIAVALGLHFTIEVTWDPLGRAARRFDRSSITTKEST